MADVKAKKALGQHFLTDLGIARRIAESISPEELPTHKEEWGALPVLEIGPGMGVLTRFLASTGRELKAVELDGESVAWLGRNMPGLDVLHADFLKMDLDGVFPGQFALIGNYPYNISSQIFFRVLDYKDRIPVAAGMLQREVAQRLCSGPGTKNYGILSVLLQAWYDCEYLFTVDETVFSPPPKVKSGVIRLTRNDRRELGVDERRFRTVVKTAFAQRRKTLRNSLAGLLPPGFEDDVLRLRPEQLTVEQFLELTRKLS